MSGIINGTDEDGGPALSNPILRQAEEQIEAALTPENRENYIKIVVAGLHVALGGGPNGGMAALRKSPDPIAQAAKGAVNLVLMMAKQSKGIMPGKAMVPAGTTLMLKALDFIDRAKIARVGNAELVRASRIFTDTLLAHFGVTKQGLTTASQKIHAITQDPAAMEKINLKAGLVKHPLAVTPTPIPDA